ncbi:MAG TPA: hypothetical protein VJP06_05145 [Thermoplasmata archaeon]|nr:hypothetical protein [Thermoplasmata archaeon]
MPTRESVAWNPGREVVNAGEDAREPEVLLEPLFWGLFSLGGFITAFLFPVTLFVLFFAAPLGLMHADPGSFLAFQTQWRMPLVRLFLFVLIAGSLFHGTHRLKFMLVDAGMRSSGAQALLDIVLNAVAILGTLGGLYYMLKGWVI